MCKEVEACDMKFEFPALGELAKACPKAHEVNTGNVGGLAHEGVADVVHTVLLKSEAVLLILTLNKQLNILPNTIC